MNTCHLPMADRFDIWQVKKMQGLHIKTIAQSQFLKFFLDLDTILLY